MRFISTVTLTVNIHKAFVHVFISCAGFTLLPGKKIPKIGDFFIFLANLFPESYTSIKGKDTGIIIF